MIVSLIVISIILLFGLWCLGQEAKTRQSYRKQYIWGISVLLILQSGLRNWAVGADTYNYFEIFETAKSYTWLETKPIVIDYYFYGIGKDPGYMIFQKIVQCFSSSYLFFLMLIAIIFFAALGNFIYKNTSRLSDAIFAFVLYSCLFFSFFSITGHRQTIATACTLFGFEWIKKRKLVPFLILILLASTIHRSCLIFIPFYFIAPLRNVRYLYVGALLSFPLLMIYKERLAQLLTEGGRYTNYEFDEGAGTYTFTFMLLFLAVISIGRMNSVLLKDERNRYLYNAFILALLFTPLTWVNPNAMRVVQYYSIFMMVLIPCVINSFEIESQQLRKIAYCLAVTVLIALFIKANSHFEYKFFWQEMELGENYR